MIESLTTDIDAYAYVAGYLAPADIKYRYPVVGMSLFDAAVSLEHWAPFSCSILLRVRAYERTIAQLELVGGVADDLFLCWHSLQGRKLSKNLELVPDSPLVALEALAEIRLPRDPRSGFDTHNIY